MKEVIFMGDSLARIRAFPSDARQDAGFQIDKVQRGEIPDVWKPMKTVGKGVKEVRIKEASGQYRVIYFQTRKMDIDLARKRLSLAGNQNG